MRNPPSLVLWAPRWSGLPQGVLGNRSRVQGLGFSVRVTEFWVTGLESRVQRLGFRVLRSGEGVLGYSYRSRV